MELYCPESKLCGYADDTSVTISSKQLDQLKELCESEVNNLLVYMAINKLAANDSKTHILVMRKGREEKKELSFNIGDAEIKEKESEKLLGVWVQNDLKWSTHLRKLESKLLSSLYNLRKIEQIIPRYLLKRVADGLFISYIRYAIGLYCPIRIKEEDPVPSNINGIKVIYNDKRTIDSFACPNKI